MKPDYRKIMLFMEELEKLKVVYRQNGIIDESRRENSAEHSWHAAVLSILLLHGQERDVDVLKIVKMLLIHDIIEIDAGDNFSLIGTKSPEEVRELEHKAAERIFALLPPDMGTDFSDLWLEFEERKTMESRFAKIMDALQPLINHLYLGKENPLGLSKSQIIGIKEFIKETSEEYWDWALEIIDESVEKGLYSDS